MRNHIEEEKEEVVEVEVIHEETPVIVLKNTPGLMVHNGEVVKDIDMGISLT